MNHHMRMAREYKKKFFIALALTIPIVIFSETVQELLGYSLPKTIITDYAIFGLSTVVYWYCGLPFLKGLIAELKKRTPGMMTLVSLAISIAYFYSIASSFIIPGKTLYWELQH